MCLHYTTSALRSGMHCCQRTSRLRCIRRVVKKKRDTWQMKRAMYGTRRASRLFEEDMKGVLKEAGYASLKVCQVYHCLETDSMAAIHGDDIIAEGKPRKLGNLRLARLASYLVGTEKLVLRFDHQEYGDTVRIAVDSDWAGSEERYSTHAGLEFHGEHPVDSWVASDQVRASSSGEAADLYGIVDGSARGIFTKHMYEEM